MPVPTPTAYASTADPTATRPVVELVADGGPMIGLGHVGRCLALWEALGGDAVFRLDHESAAGFVREHGATVVLAGELVAPLLVLDRFNPTTTEEVRELQAQDHRVVLLDDLGAGRMAADAVIDPPTAAEWPPAGALVLGGFEHVLLRHEVVVQQRGASPKGVLLAMGGSDPFGHTVPLATALAHAGIAPTIALGPAYAGDHPHDGTPLNSHTDFISALAEAELLVAGYGHTLLEAAHLGVPAVAIPTRPEHQVHAEAFLQHGTAVLATPETAARFAVELLEDRERYAAMSERGPQLVDGRGAERVAQALRDLA